MPANTRISDLTALTGTNSTATDEIIIVDVSEPDATASKKMTRAELIEMIAQNLITLQSSGLATLASVDIGGGAIDGTTIGAAVAAAGDFTTVDTSGLATLNSVNIDGGAIDGTVIGANTAAAGDFTTVASSGVATFNSLDGPIGGVTPAAGDFTTVSASGIADFSAGGAYFGTADAANLLDDYEENTYTVTLTPSGSGTITLEGAIETAQYTKVGRKVTVSGMVTVASVSSPIGYIKVNLPFTISNLSEQASSGAPSVTIVDGNAALISSYVATSVPNVAEFRIYLGDSKTLQSDAAEEMIASTDVYFNFTFTAA